MSIDFNADEIFQMAEQIERNGSAFYRRAASLTARSITAQLFLKLAAMEDEHEKTFAHMRAELSEQESKAKVSDPDDQSATYLRAWADGHVFDVRTNPAERLTGKEKAEEVLKMAIGLEKDSIVFYLGMKEAVPQRSGREKIEGIIKEEMRHMATLSNELETLRHQPI
ncbi:MAG: rubrerythrin [Deltaproteobacteria bacterium]|nr:rubrerythrin [Deltaproteobacteria bacterium]